MDEILHQTASITPNTLPEVGKEMHGPKFKLHPKFHDQIILVEQEMVGPIPIRRSDLYR
jgi:hypothetical protein